MKRTSIFTPALCAALLPIGFVLATGAVRAEESADGQYRHLDWISPEEIAAMAPEQRPLHTGMCQGVYLSPVIGDGDPGQSRVNASADRFDTSADGTLLLEGDVLIKQGSRQLQSETVRMDRASRETELTGNVVIRQPGMLIRGDHARINLNRKELDVSGTEYVIHDLHVHGSAGRIHNPSEKILILENSSYTTCEPADNAWRINAGEIKLDEESGWGQVRDATVDIKGVPVIYLPWWMFPIDDRRQTGFLFPSLGSNSDDGFKLSLPYYLNLAPNYDATFTPTFLANRGTLLEGEFRYLSPHTEGFVGFGYLPDDQLADGDDRDLLSWKHRGHYDRLVNTVDYTEVSDINYFEDLGTTLDTVTNTHLTQSADLRYFGEQWRLNATLQQYQTIDNTIIDDDLPYRRLPQLQAQGLIPVTSKPLSVILGSEYVYFEHPEANSAGLTVADNADRVRLASGLQYSFRGPWGFVVPSWVYRYRYYNISGGPQDQLEPDLDVPVFNIDSGLYFDRDFTFRDQRYIQTLEPRLYYLYVPYREQNSLPIFDTAKNSFGYEQLFRDNRFTGGDRIGDANQISLGVTSRFIDDNSGQERLNLAFGQIFYLQDREVQLNPLDPPETTEFSPYVARGYVMLNDHWSWRTETQYDGEVNNLDSLVTGLAFRSASGNLLNLNYNFYDDGAVTADPEAEKIRQTDISFMWNLNQRWGILGRWGFDLEERRSFDNIVGVEYESCCWRARLVNRRYLKESNEDLDVMEAKQGIFLQVELKGLGGVGGSVDAMLEESISGYREREDLRPPKF